MAKRKRTQDHLPVLPTKTARLDHPESAIYLQIVIGSYERILHGITAVVPKHVLDLKRSPSQDDVAISFADSFLFNAHTSAIRSLAMSPLPSPNASSQKVILATGSSDERINLYHLSTRPPKGPILPSLTSNTLHNPGNKSLGTLHTHDAAITALYFPTKSKLISSCANNVLAITSTRNWNTLSMIKAPTPKHPNRPTGDTSTASTLPSGINHFAVHPSMKLMISVGRAERCMRLWNLVTGKKAAVLNFSRDMLKAVGESPSRWGSGEGRKVLWGDGDEFAVAFEWGACIFGQDCKPKARVIPTVRTKIHQIRYVPNINPGILSISTEDGRILFYSVEVLQESQQEPDKLANGKKTNTLQLDDPIIPTCTFIGQLGGSSVGLSGRIKDYTFLELPSDEPSENISSTLLIVTAGSDGTIRIWALEKEELAVEETSEESKSSETQVGRLLGTYETGNRITCLESFILSGSDDNEDGDGVEEDIENSDSEGSDSEVSG